MANKKRRAKRGAYKARSGQRARAQDEDERLKLLERETQRGADAIAAISEGDTADIDEPLAAMWKTWEEASDRVRLESRFFARFTARVEREERAARAFLSGTLSAVVRALQTIAADPNDLRAEDRVQSWIDARAEARALGDQLLVFCAARGVNAAAWPEGSRFFDLLSDRDKAAMIDELRDPGVVLGERKLRLLQRDACAVVGVNEDYPSNVRRRRKNLVKKTG